MALTRIQLDDRRADMMRKLMKRSGRKCGTFTGLWEEFSKDLATNFRDTDYNDLLAKCVDAIKATQSHFAEHHAQACIAVIRDELLQKWKDD